MQRMAGGRRRGRTGRRAPRQLTFAVLAAGVLAFALLQSLVIPVLPTIQEELGATQADVTWVLTAYLLSASIFTPIVGRLGDMTGKKRMFVVALAALALGCLVAALATSLWVMIAARIIQGIGGGVLPLGVRDRPRRVRRGEGAGRGQVHSPSMAAAGTGVGLDPRRADRRPARSGLAVLAPADRPGGGGDRGALRRPGVAVPQRRAGSTGSRRCCCPAGWSRSCCRSAGRRSGAGARRSSWGCSPSPSSSRCCGWSSSPAPATRWWTCA